MRATKTEVTSAINGISVGGKNLLLGTAKFETSDTGYALSLVKDSTVLFKNNYTAYGNRAWLSYAIYLYYLKDRCGIKVGDTLTYSIYFMFTTNEPKDTDKKRILLRWYTTKGGPTNASVITELNLDTDSDVWRQYSYTFVVSETMLKPYVPIRFECDYYTESDYTSPRLTQWWSSPKLELGNKSTDWSPAPEDLIAESKTYTDAQLKVSADSITSTVSKTYATKTSVDTLQNIADNAIESWYLVGVPSGTNKPASDWTTDTLKKQHVGDMYYDKDTGYSYRWLQEGTAYKWVQIKDNDITNANVVANEAKSTAKSAESTANTAKTTADNASATASAASTTANGAAKAAEAAQTAADAVTKNLSDNYTTTVGMNSKIEQTANSIKQTVSETYQVKGDYQPAGDYATKNEMTTAIEQSASSISLTVSKTYATKTDLSTTNSNVTKAQNAADEAKKSASSAQSTANTAQSTANTASANASNAVDTATTAKDTADAASKTATTAKATANTAKSTADSVKTDLETNYSTTTQMNSAIDVKADGIISTVSKTYQPKGDYATNSTVQTQINQTSEEIRLDFTQSIQTNSNELQSKIDSANSSANAQFDKINKYIRFIDGKIILGETDNELALTIRNDRVSFTQSGVEVAYFSSNTLYVKRAEVLTSLRIGNYEFAPRSDGGLALRKRSVQ